MSSDTDQWFHRALQVAESGDEAERCAFARDVVDTQIRELVESEQYQLYVQEGLRYTGSLSRLLDEWAINVSEYQMGVPDNQAVPSAHVTLESETIDTARVTNTPDNSPVDTAPSLATTTFVDCLLEANLAVTTYGFEGGVTIHVTQSHGPDNGD